MRKPIEDKPPLAAWATLSREGAGMSVDEAVAALGERGHAVTAATIRGIEGGSKGASARLQKLLAIVYGVTPPGQKETGPAEGGAGYQLLAQAMDRQSAAIDRQTAAIVAAIQGRDLVLEGLLTELGSYRRSQLDFLRTLQESAPRAEPMPPDEPERPAHDVPATRAARR